MICTSTRKAGSCPPAISRWHCTPGEFAVLAALVLHDGRLLTPQGLITWVWGDADIDATRRPKDTIRRLRAKLAIVDLGSGIVAVRGLGTATYGHPTAIDPPLLTQ
jgi:DNA-binding response OmpR family regulator